ncbi:MAG: sigma factor-like helix-turn-helix DNA-binding protein [Bacteriovoracaceae bacterium]
MRSFINEKSRATNKQIMFITREVNYLPEHEQPVIYLFFWEDCSIKEIASMCGLSQSLTRKIFGEAIHRLRLSYLIEFSVPKNNRGFM